MVIIFIWFISSFNGNTSEYAYCVDDCVYDIEYCISGKGKDNCEDCVNDLERCVLRCENYYT